MGDAAANDALQATLDSLAESLKLLQTTVEANALAIQRLEAARALPGGSSFSSGTSEHHQDRQPRLQKLTSHAMTASPIR